VTSRRRASDLRYASAPKRREEILRRMRGAGYVSAPDLSADLSVSERTVRRDLQKLAELGLVDLVYGGALAPGGVAPGSPFGTRAQAQSRQKRAIAAEALRFVGPGATIGVDAGTTTVELVRMLPADGHVTVITHSLPAMGLMGERGDGTLIGVGGLHHPGTQSFAGPDAVAAIGRLRVHTFFLAASGLDRRGAYCGTPHDAEVKQAFVAIADHVVLLADSSKLRQIAPIPICGYEEVDTVVTDSAVSKPDRAALAARTTVLTVKV
jgi:DeoR/GlpR family transcriptional regulator of sugar metabolism